MYLEKKRKIFLNFDAKIIWGKCSVYLYGYFFLLQKLPVFGTTNFGYIQLENIGGVVENLQFWEEKIQRG